VDPDSARSSGSGLTTVLDRFFAQYYATHPVNATFTGVHSVDDRLPDWSPSGLARDLYELRTLLDAMPEPQTFTIASMRASTAQLDLRLARANVLTRIVEHETGFFVRRNPALWTGEAIFGPLSIMLRAYAPIAERVPKLIARLADVPRFLAAMPHVLASARQSYAADQPPALPAAWRARALRECGVARGLFADGLQQWADEQGLAQASRRNLTSAAMAAIDAFREAEAWLGRTLDAPERDAAIGADAYARLLEYGHWCDATPATLLTEAAAELETAQAALRAMAEARGMSVTAALDALADDHPAVDRYLPAFRQRWDDCRRIATAGDAIAWPEWPITYRRIPAWAREWAPQLYFLFYRSPAPFDPDTAIEYWITPIDETMPVAEQTTRLRAWNHSAITLNHVVHHGAIGHHVQNWHARYRCTSRIGKVAATDCASRIGMLQGGSLAEGWACYATTLMEELGMLTANEAFSEQHTRVRMLSRAIVDLSLHTGRMSRSACEAFYQREAWLSTAAATAEVTKNSMFPCTAIMYWLGTSRLLRLRASWREQLGERFSLRTFHDAVLRHGAIPVPLIAELLSEPTA
jgi:uncharacterized protein (DUF885 family)